VTIVQQQQQQHNATPAVVLLKEMTKTTIGVSYLTSLLLLLADAVCTVLQ
jgi:hypothetical protein